MKRKLARAPATMLFGLELFFTSNSYTTDMGSSVDIVYGATAGACDITPDLSTLETVKSDVVVTAESEQPVEEVEVYYDERLNDEQFCDDLELLALTTYAEAEGESEYGQRLVIDVILNRVDHPGFPNTIHEVIYEPDQFDIFDNGRINRVEIDEHIARLVNEELNCRTNTEVLYFNSIGFNNWSESMFDGPIGNHYFSKQKER